jgi:hypothetical protein
MTTILVLLFFVAYVSPVFFCVGLEKFARAPLDKPRSDEKYVGSHFVSQTRRSLLAHDRFASAHGRLDAK